MAGIDLAQLFSEKKRMRLGLFLEALSIPVKKQGLSFLQPIQLWRCKIRLASSSSGAPSVLGSTPS